MKVSIEIRPGLQADARRIPPVTKVFECDSSADALREVARIIEDEYGYVQPPDKSRAPEPGYLYRDLDAVRVHLHRTDA